MTTAARAHEVEDGAGDAGDEGAELEEIEGDDR